MHLYLVTAINRRYVAMQAFKRSCNLIPSTVCWTNSSLSNSFGCPKNALASKLGRGNFITGMHCPVGTPSMLILQWYSVGETCSYVHALQTASKTKNWTWINALQMNFYAFIKIHSIRNTCYVHILSIYYIYIYIYISTYLKGISSLWEFA